MDYIVIMVGLQLLDGLSSDLLVELVFNFSLDAMV